jgi:hypothetical protein
MPRSIPPRAHDTSWKTRTDASPVVQKPNGQIDGHVITPDGIVVVFSGPHMFADVDAGTYFGPTTRLRFAFGGRMHTRSYTSMLTRRGAAIVAARFSREITRSRR